MMNKKDLIKVEIPFSSSHKSLFVATISSYILLLVTTIVFLASAEETIGIHNDLMGSADGFGSKYYILLIPIIALILNSGIVALANAPHILNYPYKITEQNANTSYSKARTALLLTATVINLLFYAIVKFSLS